MTEETASFVVGKTAYPIPVSLARLLRRVEGADKSWRPELETVLEWLGKPENTPPATPPQWEQVEVFGHQKHVGIVTEIEELGSRFLRIDVPAYTYQRRRYSARVVKVSPAAIFRRIACSEAEAQTRLGYQTNLFDGEPLPGLLVEEARHRLGPTSDRAADLLGMPREEYAAIERCAVDIGAERAQQIIADLAAAWVAAKAADHKERNTPPPGYKVERIDDDRDDGPVWCWRYQDESSSEFGTYEEAVDDAWESHRDAMNDEVPSNATAEAPAAEDIERLDVSWSEPPAGYYVDWVPDDEDDPEGPGEWVWGTAVDANGNNAERRSQIAERHQLGEAETREEAVAACWREENAGVTSG